MKTLYQISKKGKIKEWKLWIEEQGVSGFPELWCEWGFSDGKKQTTRMVVSEGVNTGKANATTPLEQAKLLYERSLLSKMEDGYTEEVGKIESKDIDWNKPLPQELVFFKPQNSIEDSKISKLESQNRAVYTVKRDGMCHIVRKTDKVEIYSRRMDLFTNKFPHLEKVLSSIPSGTILLGEIVKIKTDGSDDFRTVSSVCRSLPEEAVRKQDEETGPLSYYIFDIAFYGYQDLLSTKTFSQRRDILKKLVEQINSGHVLLSEIINKTHSEAKKEVISRQMEGLVIYDRDGIMDPEDAFTFTGKANRPNVLWKSKPKYEDDFIVRYNPAEGIGDYGKGKLNGKLGKVFIYQLQDGKEVFLGRCGGGLSEKQRDFYNDPTLFPRVWAIEYDSIQPKTGSPRFPVFNRDRTIDNDKKIEECLISHTILNARQTEAEDDEEE